MRTAAIEVGAEYAVSTTSGSIYNLYDYESGRTLAKRAKVVAVLDAEDLRGKRSEEREEITGVPRRRQYHTGPGAVIAIEVRLSSGLSCERFSDRVERMTVPPAAVKLPWADYRKARKAYLAAERRRKAEMAERKKRLNSTIGALEDLLGEGSVRETERGGKVSLDLEAAERVLQLLEEG